MSEIDEETAARWRRIQEVLSNDRFRAELVRASLAAFQFAQFAYNAAYNGGPDGDGITMAGISAYQYCTVFEYIRKELLNDISPKETVDKMQTVSDWLERMGWHGRPRSVFVGMREMPLTRTADGMHSDMIRYRDSALRTRCAAARCSAA